jgi:hypothetical protein
MSTIAAKKGQQKKTGPETILFYSSGVFLIAIGIELILYLIIKFPLNGTIMWPLIYCLMMAGLMLGVGTYIRENRADTEMILRNWFFSMILLSILSGIAYGAYIW